MSEIEKSKLIQLLMEQRNEARRREEAASQERMTLQNRILHKNTMLTNVFYRKKKRCKFVRLKLYP